ncbi:hypothetical protein [Halobaculum litoreum]|uniref:DUF5658 domain-containing protein n=1 Tax=Halobaculum litoreum TaxID=3031998 RepID=A0ABD5XZ01_9EURY|nr:hypothetical protein [Halobaculum sp. DT92]
MTGDAGGDDRPDGVAGWLSLAGTPFDDVEFSRLWFVATLTYGVGDVVTTLALIGYSDTVNEANALIAAAVGGFGEAGLIAVKLAVFGVCLAISLSSARAGDRVGYYLPPVALSFVGAFTTALNLRLLIG